MPTAPPPIRLTDRKRDAIVQAAINEFRRARLQRHQHGPRGHSRRRLQTHCAANPFPQQEALFEAIPGPSVGPQPVGHRPTVRRRTPAAQPVAGTAGAEMQLLGVPVSSTSRAWPWPKSCTPRTGPGHGGAAVRRRKKPAQWIRAAQDDGRLRPGVDAHYAATSCGMVKSFFLAPAGHGPAPTDAAQQAAGAGRCGGRISGVLRGSPLNWPRRHHACPTASRPVRHPPMTQLNHTVPLHRLPHGFLRSRGVARGAGGPGAGAGAEPALARRAARRCLPGRMRCRQKQSPAVQSFAAQQDRYLATIGPVAGRGARHAGAHRIVGHNLPARGAAFCHARRVCRRRAATIPAWLLAPRACTTKAKHLATLYLNDPPMCCAMRWTRASSSSAATRSLAGSQPTFEPLAQALAAPPTLVDEMLRTLTLESMTRHARCGAAVGAFPGSCMRRFALHRPSRHTTPRSSRCWAGGQHRTAHAGRAARV